MPLVSVQLGSTPDAPRRERRATAMSADPSAFDARFRLLFDAECPRIMRVLTRLSGDAELAADLAQEAFIRLHDRGAMPDVPGAWLISVALNLLRNTRSMERRRRELLTLERGAAVHSEATVLPDEVTAREDAERLQAQVRVALDRLPARERQLLLLRAEGYGYREIAEALSLNAASIGVMLARAKERFRILYDEASNAP
ncbi:MAG: sigma-70 family RNA polymerase sigma factor [Gemmatimonadaceae bacterium]